MSITTKILISIVAVAAIAFFAWRIVNRLDPPDPITKTFGPYQVAGALTGASLDLARGINGRRHQTGILNDVAAPAEGESFFEESRSALEAIAGKSATVEVEKGRILEHVSKLDGQWYGESGQCLQLSQLSAGWAWCLPDAPKAYQEAEKVAKKSKIGIWTKPKIEKEFAQ